MESLSEVPSSFHLKHRVEHQVVEVLNCLLHASYPFFYFFHLLCSLVAIPTAFATLLDVVEEEEMALLAGKK